MTVIFSPVFLELSLAALRVPAQDCSCDRSTGSSGCSASPCSSQRSPEAWTGSTRRPEARSEFDRDV